MSIFQPISVTRATTGNVGPLPRMNWRTTVAMTTAAVTGTRLRGRHSNNSSFDGQQNGCQRSVERRRHAAGGTGNKQRFSFICGQVQVLSQDRTERPAGHDDGSLSAERATGADADRRRNRLEHSNFGFDAAAPGENGLNGLGHPMTANLVRTEPRHPARRPDRRRRGRPVSATTDGVALPAPQARWSNVGRRQDWSPVRST